LRMRRPPLSPRFPYTTLFRSESVLKWFADSPNGILCNVGILTRGFDQPDIEVVILYRATKSLPLFLQMVGRGSRTTPTKKDFYIDRKSTRLNSSHVKISYAVF